MVAVCAFAGKAAPKKAKYVPNKAIDQRVID
jgi:hypothetical protein